MQERIDEAIDYCDARGIPARIVNLKPRQGGSSSYFVAKAYHKCRTTAGDGAILGDDGNTTEKLMRMWTRYRENDAMEGYWGNRPRTSAGMDFTHGASLTLETANDPRAGQGGTFNFLIASEVASYRSSGHSTGEDVFSSIAGCVPKLPGTLIVLESTAQGMVGIFYNTYQGAVTLEELKGGKRGNGYIKFFTPWFSFEDYQFDGKDGRLALTDWQRQNILDTLDDREKELITQFGAEVITPEKLAFRRETIAAPDCGGDPDKFDREYPSDDVSCFRATGSAFFDMPGLTWQERVITPLAPLIQPGDITVQGDAAFWRPRLDRGGEYQIIEPPIENESYLIAVDWCVGKQAAGSKRERDTNSIAVWRAERLDPTTQRIRLAQCVAMTRDEDRSSTDIAIQRVLALHRLYGNCIVVPEINNKDNICGQLLAAGVKNIWTQRQGADGAMPGMGRTEEVMGFLTGDTAAGTGTRRQILANMLKLTREQVFICTFKPILHQMKQFILNSRGKAEAAPGEHDDHVLQTAIALFCLPAATLYRKPGQMAANQRARQGVEIPLHPMGL
jgi:hypothetical protein